MNAWRQLPLPFSHQPEFAAADFLRAPSNDAALTWIGQTAAWPGGRLVIWGAAGVGKTHLLHIWARLAGAAILPGPMLRGWPAAPGPGGIALDDADLAEETALLHLINVVAEARQPLLLAARVAPARWPTRLADLRSRLRATTAVQVEVAGDELLRALLARLLADRQLAVSENLQEWILARLPRTQAALREAVARLDRAALAAGGLNRTVALDVLAEMTQSERDEEIFFQTSHSGPMLL